MKIHKNINTGDSSAPVNQAGQFIQRRLLRTTPEHSPNGKPSQNSHAPFFTKSTQPPPSPNVQAKLTIDTPNDKFEQDADRVADQVMRMPGPPAHTVTETPGTHHSPNRQYLFKDSEAVLQAKEASGTTPQVSSQTAARIQNLKGGGQALSTSSRAFFEPRFGRSFESVRIHNDATANQLANELNARAFTSESDVAFAQGQYQPETTEGQKLMAHELTHVVQQTGKRNSILKKPYPLQSPLPDNPRATAQGRSLSPQPIQVNQHKSSFGQIVQRFEAPVHESIELGGLTGGSAGLTPEEASAVYFGNWMRDVNQVFVPTITNAIGVPPSVVFSIVNYLAVRHFGRDMTPEQFGYYLPPEHIDNPGGLAPARTTLPTPGASYRTTDQLPDQPVIPLPTTSPHPDERPRPAPFVTQQEDVLPVNMQGGQAGRVLGANIFSVDQTGMMAFIRRTNQHVERRLEWAALRGRNSDGLLNFGAALHSIEDFFTHSNFVEIAVNRTLQQNPQLLPELQGRQRRVHTFSPEVRVPSRRPGARRGATERRAVLTTGTFTGADTQISITAELVNLLAERPGPPRSPAEARAEQQMMIQILQTLSTQLQNDPQFRRKVVDAIMDRVPASFRGSTTRGLLDRGLQTVPLADVYRYTRIPIYLRPVLDAIGITELQQIIKNAFFEHVMEPASRQVQALANEARARETSLLFQRELHTRIAEGRFTPMEIEQ